MKKILLLVALLTSNAVFASDGWRWMAVTDSMVKTSQADACNDGKGYGAIPSGWTYTGVVNSNGDQATCNWNNHGNYTGTIGRVACADPMVITNGVCALPPPVCTPGRQYSVEVPMGTVSAPEMKYPTQLGGCRVYVGGVEQCNSNKVTGALQCTLRVTEGGVAPTGGANDSTSAPIADSKPENVPPHNPGLGQGCPAGTVSLGIDSTGGSICGGSGTSAAAPTKTEVKEPPTTVTNSDGSTDRVDISHRTNSDGSITTTTKTTTTGADGKVTVKEVPVTGPKPAGAGGSGGGAGVSDAKDEDKTDLCKLHPELNICKNSQVTAGACAGGSDSTSCTGDAIQCAILRQQKKEYCENTKDSAIGTLGNQLLAGNDPMKVQIDAAKLGTPFDLGSQSFDQSSFAPSACFGAKSGSVNGHAISIDFSRACSSAANIRLAVLALCSLVGFLIVARSISQV